MCRCTGILRTHTSLCKVSVSARYQDFWNEEIVLHFSIAATIIWFCIFHVTGGPCFCMVAGLGGVLSLNSQGTIALCATTVQNEGKKHSLVHEYKMLWNSPFNLNLAISCSSSRPGYFGLQWVTFSAVGWAEESEAHCALASVVSGSHVRAHQQHGGAA